MSKRIARIEKQVSEIAENMERAHFADYIAYVGDTKKLIRRSFLSGLFRGFGAAIGFSVLGALIVLLLRRLAVSSVPFIADFITKIIDIIEKS